MASFEISIEALRQQNPQFSDVAISGLHTFITKTIPMVVDGNSLRQELYLDADIADANGNYLDELTVTIDDSYEDAEDDAVQGEVSIFASMSNQTGDYLYRRLNIKEDGRIITNNDEIMLDIGTVEDILHKLPDVVQTLPAAIHKNQEWRREIKEFQAARQAEEQAASEQIPPRLDTMRAGPLEVAKVNMTTQDLLGDNFGELPKALSTAGFAPAFKQSIGEHTNVYYSRAFRERNDDGVDGRTYIIGYVETIDGWQPNVFYVSQSHACWRWLPDYRAEDGWYGKGDAQGAMAPPAAIQGSLNTIQAMAGVGVIKEESLDKLLANELLVSQLTGKDQELKNIYARYINAEYISEQDEKRLPDFTTKPVSSNTLESNLYGTVYLDRFLSRDGSIDYTFAHSAEGLAWLQTASQTSAKIRQYGLIPNSQPAFSGALDQPAYEYHAKGAPHPVHSQYFNNFYAVAESGVIQQYYRTIPRERFAFMQNAPAGIRPSVEMYLATQYHKIDPIVFSVVDAAVGKPFAREIAYDAQRVLYDLKSVAGGEDLRVLTGGSDLMYTMGLLRYEDDSFENLVEGNEEMYDVIMDGLQFSLKTTKSEKHDETVEYEYWRSDLVSGSQVVVSRKSGKIVAINVIPA